MDILEVNKALYRNVDGKKVKINPLAKAECIIMSDGRTLEEVILELQQLVKGQSEQGLDEEKIEE